MKEKRISKIVVQNKHKLFDMMICDDTHIAHRAIVFASGIYYLLFFSLLIFYMRTRTSAAVSHFFPLYFGFY